MAKTASERRLAKRSSALAQLAGSNPEHLKRVLETLLRGWVNEARYRASAFRHETGDDAPLKAFAVIEHAQRALLALGPQAVSLGQGVLATLRHECAKAVAEAGDRRLYLSAVDCTTKLRMCNVRDRRRD